VGEEQIDRIAESQGVDPEQVKKQLEQKDQEIPDYSIQINVEGLEKPVGKGVNGEEDVDAEKIILKMFDIIANPTKQEYADKLGTVDSDDGQDVETLAKTLER